MSNNFRNDCKNYGKHFEKDEAEMQYVVTLKRSFGAIVAQLLRANLKVG
jgi:hypothetical protein